jgi:hypothetical protein
MFKKSLILACMVFGLNAWSHPPVMITKQRLIAMIQGNGQIQGDQQETWTLDRNEYCVSGAGGPAHLNGPEVDQAAFLAFVQGIPADPFRADILAPWPEEFGHPLVKVRYKVISLRAPAGAPPYSFTLRRQ